MTESPGRSSVVIAVLTWRGYENARTCLESLQGLAGWPIPTLVVDNGSGTGEGARLAAEFGEPVHALTLDHNGGVPSGYNAAMQWAARQGAQYVLLLNNDTVAVDPMLLERLVRAMGDRVAVAGPTTLETDGSLFSAGGRLNWVIGRGSMITTPPKSGIYEVDWLDGCCLLVSIEAARVIGGLAPEYFMYWEELEWCIRARRHGYRCVVDPSTSIRHARSTREPSMQIRYLMLRNGILFMRRNGTWPQNFTSFVWTVFYRCPGMIVRRLGRPMEAAKMARAISRALAWNVKDAVSRGRWRVPPVSPPIS